MPSTMSATGLSMNGSRDRVLGMAETDPVWILDKLFFRTILNSLKIWKIFQHTQGRELTPGQVKVMSTAEDGKLISGVIGFPEAISKFVKAAFQFTKEPSLYHAKEVVVKFTAIGAPVVDTYDLVIKHITTAVPYAFTVLAKGFCSLGLMIGMTDFGTKSVIDIGKQVSDISKAGIDRVKGTATKQTIDNGINALIRVAKAISDLVFSGSYFLIGLISFSTFWIGVILAKPVIFISALVSAIVFTTLGTLALLSAIFSKFWDKIFVQAIPAPKLEVKPQVELKPQGSKVGS